jgi:hypothetical protein
MSSKEIVDSLKRVQPPLWSRLLGSYRAWRRNRRLLRQNQYIATVYHWTYWTDAKSFSRAWYICKEDGRGIRTVDYGCDSRALDDREKSTAVYASIIVPWMHGRLSNDEVAAVAKRRYQQPAVPQ